MSNEDEDFVVLRNIDRFTRLLASEGNSEKRATLKILLQEERAKQGKSSPPTDAYLRD